MNESDYTAIKNRTKSELQPYLDGIRTKREAFELFRDSFSDFVGRFLKTWNLFFVLVKGFLQAPATAHALFLYLGCIESLGNSIVDIVVMLLVANGKDFHIECRYATPRIKHAKSINDLENERVPLAAKLNFLKDNGIKELPRLLDNELRNDIAHLKFDVRGDLIFIRKKPADKILSSNFENLINALRATEECLSEVATDAYFPRRKG